MEQIEDGQVDHKILAVMNGKETSLGEDMRTKLVEFSSHVFDHIPGKTMQIGEFRDQSAALAYLREHQDPALAG
jgi:hypothetical protein